MTASPKQIGFAKSLLSERDVPDTFRAFAEEQFTAEVTPKAFGALVIDPLLAAAFKVSPLAAGIYTVDGTVYRVQESKKGTMYAKVQGEDGKFTYDVEAIHRIPAGSEPDAPAEPKQPWTAVPAPKQTVTFKPVTQAHAVPDIAEGTYLFEDQVYQVQKSKLSGKKYAKVLKHGKFTYDPGAIFRLPADAQTVTIAEAIQWGLRFNRCIHCGRQLEKADSVLLAIGPVCAKRHHGLTQKQLIAAQQGATSSEPVADTVPVLI